MDRRKVLRGSLTPAVLAAVWLYAGVFSIPIIGAAMKNGVSPRLNERHAEVRHVLTDSTAAAAGFRQGDRIVEWAGWPIAEWYVLFQRDHGRYLERCAALFDSTASVTVARGDERHVLTLTHAMATRGMGWFSLAFRIGVALFMTGVACFIVWSNPADRLGRIAALGMAFAVWSMLSGTRYSQLFLGPYLARMSAAQFLVVSLVSTLALVLMLGSLLRFARLFPEGRRESGLALWFIYGAPLLGATLATLLASGTLSQRLSTLYPFKLVFTMTYLAMSCFFIVRTYLASESPLARERIRWIGSAILLAAGSSLVFWVIPKWLWDRPLVLNIDWMFLPLALIPVAILISINRHHLFGITGLAHRRIRGLEKQLQREKRLVTSRDGRIGQLSAEIQQLRHELDAFQRAEHGQAIGAARGSDRLRKLEARYPDIAMLRREKLIGTHPCWERIFEQVVLAAQIPDSALILGESGTGKTDIARAIHRLGPRRDRVYREISCSQFEHGDPSFPLGKFFGIGKDHGMAHIRKEGRPGLLMECDGGTLFLDDVDRLPPHVQDFLLYPLEGKPFEPGIGAGGPINVNVKFLFASNRDLEELAAAGSFRADILARMGTRVRIPPLRERREDLPPLIDLFVARINEELGRDIAEISPKAMTLLCDHDYRDGNVRELKRLLKMAMARAGLEEDRILRAGYLAPHLHERAETAPQSQPGDAADSPAQAQAGEHVSRELAVLRKFRFHIKESEIELGLSHKSRTLSHHLRGICLDALREMDWDVRRASRRVVGGDAKRGNQKIANKMARLLQRIQDKVAAGEEAKLFNNLPAKYHSALRQAIQRAGQEPTSLSP